MDKDIGIGLIIGLIIGIILYTANSDKFSRVQKISIYISSVFFPLQILLLITYLIYNSQKKDEPIKIHNKQEIQKETNVFDNRLQSLKDLKESGILTEEEYIQKSKNIESSKLDTELKESSNYKKLKSLYDDGVLTKEEFENKVEILKNNISSTKVNNEPYFEGLRVFTNEDLNYGFEDEMGNIIVEPIYELAENFKEGLAIVRKNRKFGFIDKSGNVVIDIRFDYAESFENGLALVLEGDNKFYINIMGEKDGNL